jgi:hypothetical protein
LTAEWAKAMIGAETRQFGKRDPGGRRGLAAAVVRVKFKSR